MLRDVKLPKAFQIALRQPRQVLTNGRILSQTEKLRLRLAEYYSKSNNEYNSPQADTGRRQINDEVWNQSGQVMQWLGEHVSKRTVRPSETNHRQEVAGLVNRLIANEPLAYILGELPDFNLEEIKHWCQTLTILKSIGSQPFGPLDIQCQKPTLIPRPETEFLSEHLAELICKSSTISSPNDRRIKREPLRILDLCTGTGCIALLLQHRLNEAGIDSKITAVDKSNSALKLANHNLNALHEARVSKQEIDSSLTRPKKSVSKVILEQLDIFNDEQTEGFLSSYGPFDIVVSNPPYISTSEWKGLDKGVREWEDPIALIGDIDSAEDSGLAFYNRIALLIRKHHLLSLKSSTMPSILVEVGHTQAHQIQNLFTHIGCFSRSTIIKDPWSLDRGVMAWARPSHHS